MRALNSVGAQTYSHLEIVVVDDASRDDTAALAGAWKGRPIRVERLEKNGGVSAARNRGMQLAAGKYIAFLDADDEWLPENVRLAYQELQAETKGDAKADSPLDKNGIRPINVADPNSGGGGGAVKPEAIERIDGYHEK